MVSYFEKLPIAGLTAAPGLLVDRRQGAGTGSGAALLAWRCRCQAVERIRSPSKIIGERSCCVRGKAQLVSVVFLIAPLWVPQPERDVHVGASGVGRCKLDSCWHVAESS